MDYLIIALTKVLDSMISTSKSILVYKNKILLASMMIGVSQSSYLFVVRQVIKEKTFLSIVVAGFAAFLGALLAFKVVDIFFSKENIYLNVIACDSIDEVKKFVEYIRFHKIDNVVNDSYTEQWEKTLSVQVQAKNKKESKLLDDYFDKCPVKFFRQVTEVKQVITESR